ncbi:hypothetical protein [Wolbachia endosymbiont (group A) of Scambus nigricans]|nr:hypothetical protein [Wolbachia endosymbiont (group A) of Scambus nigricans]
MLLACYSHKHISYRIRTIIRRAINCTANGVIPVLDTGIQKFCL